MNNRKGLNWRQVRYINLILLAKCTTEQVMASLGMRPSTLIKWLEKEAFKKEWTAALGVLDMLRSTDEKICAINASRHAPPPMTGLTHPQTCEAPAPPGIDDPPGATELRPAREIDRSSGKHEEQLSERERIRARNGEEAVQAYDRLMRLHELHRQAREAAEAAQPPEEGKSAPEGASPAEAKLHEADEVAADTSTVDAKSDDIGEPPANFPPPDPAGANGGEFKTMGELGS